jgi:hypothetical protein
LILQRLNDLIVDLDDIEALLAVDDRLVADRRCRWTLRRKPGAAGKRQDGDQKREDRQVPGAARVDNLIHWRCVKRGAARRATCPSSAKSAVRHQYAELVFAGAQCRGARFSAKQIPRFAFCNHRVKPVVPPKPQRRVRDTAATLSPEEGNWYPLILVSRFWLVYQLHDNRWPGPTRVDQFANSIALGVFRC